MRTGVLWLEAATSQRRFGIKGPRAAEMLQRHGFNVPARPNTWSPLRTQDADGSLNVVARLGNTEFFLEEQGDGSSIAALEESLSGVSGVSGAWPVLREDFAMVLGGVRALDALAEVCNVEFGALALEEKPVVLTLVTGVSVLVLPQRLDTPVYRIWCDPSFGSYLWETLADVVATTTTGRGG
jgi:sarcosine oxidase, subunit gamma